MENNILYAQSGGPTAVINSSAYGVFKRALKCDAIDNCYAGCNGIEGILKGDFVKIYEVLCTLYSSDKNKLDEAKELILKAYEFSDKKPEKTPHIYKIIE